LQSQLHQSKNDAESLRKQINEKSKSSNSDVNAKWAELNLVESQNRKKELEIKENESKREQDRKDKESNERIKQMKEETKIAREQADREARKQAKQEEREKRNIFKKG